MLDILDLILGLLEVDDLDGNDLLGPIVEAFVDLSEGSLPDSLLLREDQLRIDSLKRKSKHWSRLMPEAFRSTPDFLGEVTLPWAWLLPVAVVRLHDGDLHAVGYGHR